MVKEFEKPALNPNYSSDANLRKLEKLHSGQISPTKTSPYSDLDKFIMTRIRPHGHIYRNVHFPSTNVTVYDIKGFRYCGNIGRWHKSQNIKLIADINRGVYYQKCHDAECADYKSPEWPIPPEVWFKIRPPDEEDLLLENGLDELEGILNGETTCIPQSTGTPCIQQRTTDNEHTPCIQTSSRNNGAPCIQTSAPDETYCLQTSNRNNGTPCIQQISNNNDAPCIQTSSHAEKPCIPTNNSIDCDKRLSEPQAQVKIEPPCILQTDSSETPCIEGDNADNEERNRKRTALKRVNNDDELSCIEQTSEPPCIERKDGVESASKEEIGEEREPKRPCIQKLHRSNIS
uniref:DNA-directed primase/polymerase protein n=1 Tax=Cacopsylla melanoneura TaxID=428564 RepID=A0A8D8SJT9_9HEMI